jgi:hypothetical protein
MSDSTDKPTDKLAEAKEEVFTLSDVNREVQRVRALAERYDAVRSNAVWAKDKDKYFIVFTVFQELADEMRRINLRFLPPSVRESLIPVLDEILDYLGGYDSLKSKPDRTLDLYSKNFTSLEESVNGWLRLQERGGGAAGIVSEPSYKYRRGSLLMGRFLFNGLMGRFALFFWTTLFIAWRVFDALRAVVNVTERIVYSIVSIGIFFGVLMIVLNDLWIALRAYRDE